MLFRSTEKQDGAIEISNGNGVSRMARDMGSYLKRRGYNVVRFTNAGNFNLANARIYFMGPHEKLARRIASEFPEIKEVKRIKRLDRPNLKVKVIIGKDLTKYRQIFREDVRIWG